jgi:pimeloyl-ACP methyl ester carboxylesterase
MRPKICYIHGLNQTHRSFTYLSQELEHNGDVLIDYDSRQPLEDSIKQVMKFVPKDEELVLIGHSLGGLIALLIAARGLANAQKIVTISSPLGGSKAAIYARWVVQGVPLLRDLVPNSAQIREVASMKLAVPVLNVISTAGSLPTANEPNDGIVTISSQKAYAPGKKVELKANHFEIMMHERLPVIIRKFIDG